MQNGNSLVNPTTRFSQVELDGEEYSLVFDFNAIATAESVAKVNLLEGMNLQGMTARQFRGLFYAALLKAQPDITLEQAGELISLKNFPLIKEAIAQAWLNSVAPANAENPLGPVAVPATQ